MNYKTLVIAPHCDDEVLGCGRRDGNHRTGNILNGQGRVALKFYV